MNDVCFFAHFDRSDVVEPYVLHYLRALHDAGFSTVFITTSNIGAEDETRVREWCFDVIRRENRGLDFASWREALNRYKGRISGRLLLANDSVFGPFSSLTTVLKRLLSSKADFYGLIESRQIATHLQSWFLLFEPEVVASPAFAAVFDQDFAAMTKAEIIRNGEVGMTRRLVAAGYRYRALVAFEDDHPLAAFNFNPMHILAQELIQDGSLPFAKVEVLRDRLSSDKRHACLAVIAEHSPLWAQMIADVLQRTAAGTRSTGKAESPLYRFCLNVYLESLRYIYRNTHAGTPKHVTLLTATLPVIHKAVKRIRRI